jgi:hypothetical protein
VRFPWHDFEALRASAVDAIAQGVEACLAVKPAASNKPAKMARPRKG